MTKIERLQKAIRDLHGCDSRHLMSVPIHETFQEQPAWEGTVEVFFLINHPHAKEAYAWSTRMMKAKRALFRSWAFYPSKLLSMLFELTYLQRSRSKRKNLNDWGI